MRTRSNNPFSTVTTSGLLLPIDLLARVADGDPDLKGLQAKDYHLRSGERLNEAAARAWNGCVAAWKSFRKRFDSLPASDIGTTTTRDEWLLPLFQELGYGRLQTKKALDFDGTEYPITHGWEDHVPIHLLSARLPLDRRTAGISGAAARAPYSLMQELLNRSAANRWGFVTNGLKLFLLRDNAALARAANVEFDLEAMMDGEVYADFFLLFCLCHQSRVEIRSTGKEDEDAKPNPEDCWLEDWANQADQQGTRAREKLRDGVESSIKSLGAGFLTTKGNEALRARLANGELSTQDFYRQLLRLVYRLLMLLVAEEKRSESGDNLLHPPGTSPEIRDRYARFYGVGRVRELASKRRGTAHTDLYDSLKVLFVKLRTGYAPLGIPGMGSFLFSDDSTPDLDDALLANRALLNTFDQLCHIDDTSSRGGANRRPVDFGNLGSEELGSVYESLLELHPLIDEGGEPFTLGTAAGHERKTTGSYYTPTSLINCLLDSALDPVVHEAIDVSDPAEAERKLLDLKVCDPACGSGHFLIAAADRMAMHLARIRTGDDQPNTIDIQAAKRDIIGRCIYGVDINPMAVELCKVSLWMEALEPGKPLSFLDHHIQCGNSLLGATPRLLAEGIPDDAFKPIEGDDKEVCKELKKRNKREREDYKNKQGYLFEPILMLGNLTGEFAKLTAAEDGSLDSIAAKRDKYAELVKGTNYQNARLWADTWYAAFMWKKEDSDLGWLCPSERSFRAIERSPHSVNLAVRVEIERLSMRFQFLHWHLAFPDVFALDDTDSAQGNGWSQGFSVVLGNPPWERVKLQEKEWFAERSPMIAGAPTAAIRKRMIRDLKQSDKKLRENFLSDLRKSECLSTFMRHSGKYPLCGRGDINVYTIFAETMRSIISPDGAFGAIFPSGLATEDTTKFFFADLTQTGTLASFYELENEGFFTNVGQGHMVRFALTTVLGSSRTKTETDFVFQAKSIGELCEGNRHFSLSGDDIARLNPNTMTCPIFTSLIDAEISKQIYRRIPVLCNDSHKRGNLWGITFSRMFDMSNDSSFFHTKEQLESEGWTRRRNGYERDRRRMVPLYESKMVNHFNHRSGDFSAVADGARAHVLPQVDSESLSNASYFAQPFYWVDDDEVTARCGSHSVDWMIGFRNVTDSRASARSVIAATIPHAGAGNSLPVIVSTMPDRGLLTLVASILSSFVFDFCARFKIAGLNLNFFILKQLPFAPPEMFLLDASWLNSERSVKSSLLGGILELTFTAVDIECFAADCNYDGTPFRWDEERPFEIRCELDAAYFHLYLGSEEEWGADNPTLLEMFPTPRHAIDYIMDTFPIVRRKDEAKYDGEYKTKTTILRIYDEMANVIRANNTVRAANPDKSDADLRSQFQSYQSQLSPPPGPPTDAQGNFIPFADWTDEIHATYRDVIHLESQELNEKQQAKLEQGKAIIYLRLLLKEHGQPVQRDVFQLDLCFALNPELRRRVLLDQPIVDAERSQRPPTNILPQLRKQLETLAENGVIKLDMVGRRQTIELLDDSDLDTPLCVAMMGQVREAIEATAKILDKRDDDDFSEEAFAKLQPFMKEGEVENLATL